MGTKRLIWFVIFLFLISSVSASFNVQIEPDEQTIKIGEKATFNLTVSHDTSLTQYFEIYSSEVQWDISTVPSKDRVLEVPPGQRKSTTLVLRPLYPDTGLFVVDITVKLSGTNDFIKQNLLIGIARTTDEYSPSVFTKIDMPKQIDPREEISIKITLENQNRRFIQDLDIKLRSILINKDHSTSLKPLETKEIEFKIKLDDTTPPQEDSLKISLFAKARNKTTRFDMPGQAFEIKSYGKVEDNIEVKKNFLSTTREITFINTGNDIQKKSFHYPSSIFARIFTSSDHPFYKTKTSEGRVLVWDIELGPAETKTVKVTRNYRPLFLIILLLIIAVVGYFVFRSPLMVKKAAMVVETKEGGISELKIFISMRNRTNYPVRNLVVLDKIPKIAEVKSDFELGTLRPSKIHHSAERGTLLRWNIDNLGPKEERILSYKVKTKLSILGSFRLPSTKIKFKFFNYERVSFSNMENLFAQK